MEDICRASPENQQYRYRRAIVRMHVASVALDRGEVDASATEYRNAYEELLSLQQIDPKNAQWRRESITAGLEYGLVESFRGEEKKARALVATNARAVADLARRNPATPESILLQALALAQQLRIGDNSVSGTSLAREIQALRRLLEKAPANLSARNWLAKMLLLRASRGHHEPAPRANSDAKEAIAILGTPGHPSSKARFYSQQVNAYLLAGDRTEAMKIIGKLSGMGYLHPSYIQLLRSFQLEQADEQGKSHQEQK
jgi:hypothetical protein